MDNIEQLLSQAKAAIAASTDLNVLEQVRVEYLGKKGHITTLLKNLSSIPGDQRREAGQAINEAKKTITSLLETQKEALSKQQLAEQLANERIDITLPGRGQSQGSLHPNTQVLRMIESFFTPLGFTVAEGPEIEDDYHNFSALNFPDHHPARDTQDTIYLSNGLLLRTHTSSVQIRTMKNQKPPIRIIVPGRAYRNDDIDMTHTPMFNQIEGLMVGDDITFTDLKGMLVDWMQSFFGDKIPTRFRPSYFPFVEPGAELDVQCFKCKGEGCSVCSRTGWLEILGCGMVHPNVLEEVGIDSEKYSGWAFGGGIDRLAMLRFGIDDLRLFFNNDLRFLQQF